VAHDARVILTTAMRIFVHEHVAGGGLSGRPLPPTLAREGRAMLEAACADLAAIEGVEVWATLDARSEPFDAPRACRMHRVSERRDAAGLFDALSRAADGVLLIAPELDGDLLRLARRVLGAGGRLLGPEPGAIEAASDKLLLPRLLAAVGVPSVRAAPYAGTAPEGFPLPAVVKPRRGAGSTGVVLLEGGAPMPPPERESIITELAPGLAASVLLILGPRRALALRACEQLLSADGRFSYLGGRLPLPPELEARARPLALAAARAVPGLLGFAGVDLVLDVSGRPDPDDRVIEVNARLTTSYIGLRAHAASNLAAAWLAAVTGGEIPQPAWRAGVIEITAGGAFAVAAA
jgi:predicted ATP-grasp superfamily ATP-dependent carboligase